MTKLFRFTFVFLIVSSCLLRAESKFLEEWWTGKGAAGDLFGVRPILEDRGLDFSGHWGSTFAGVVAGGLQHRGTFVEQVRFELEVDFAKLTGWEPLEGLTDTPACAGVTASSLIRSSERPVCSARWIIEVAMDGASCPFSSPIRRRGSLA